MASGPRRKLEPFEKYRERLIEEHKALKAYIKGAMFWPGNYINRDGKISKAASYGTFRKEMLKR